MPPPAISSPVVRYKLAIASRFFLRFHMGLMYTAASIAGVGASKLLLGWGLVKTIVRYPLAVMAAYVVFVLLLRVWIFYVQHSHGDAQSRVPEVDIDVVDVGADLVPSLPRSSGGGSTGFSLDIGDEAFWVVAALMVLVAVIAGCGVYLIYIAPDFLPELAVSAALGASIERAAKRAESEGWLTGAVRATAFPFGVVLVLAMVLGYAVQATCPGAVRLMDAMNCPAA